MKNNKILIGAIIILVLINIFTLLYAFNQRGHKFKNGAPKNRMKMIEKRLDLTSEQVVWFEKAFNEHRKWIDENSDVVFSLRKKMYQAAQQNDTAQLQQLSDSIGQIQAFKERKTAIHFATIRKWCNGNQQKKLDRMILRQMEHMKKR